MLEWKKSPGYSIINHLPPTRHSSFSLYQKINRNLRSSTSTHSKLTNRTIFKSKVQKFDELSLSESTFAQNRAYRSNDPEERVSGESFKKFPRYCGWVRWPSVNRLHENRKARVGVHSSSWMDTVQSFAFHGSAKPDFTWSLDDSNDQTLRSDCSSARDRIRSVPSDDNETFNRRVGYYQPP